MKHLFFPAIIFIFMGTCTSYATSPTNAGDTTNLQAKLDHMPGYSSPPTHITGPIKHPLIGVALPPANYYPDEYIRLPDPWDKRMILRFNTFLTPKTSGPVEMEVYWDGSGNIPIGSTLLGKAKPFKNQVIIVWIRLTYPNGIVGWSTGYMSKAEEDRRLGTISHLQ